MERLEDKILLVTGAGSDTGWATALACGKEGSEVVVADIDRASANETAGLIRKNGGRGWAAI